MNRAQKGQQNIKEKTNHNGVGPVGSWSYASRSHDIEIVNILVSFLYEQGVEINVILHKENPHASVRWTAPTAIQESTSVGGHRFIATNRSHQNPQLVLLSLYSELSDFSVTHLDTI